MRISYTILFLFKLLILVNLAVAEIAEIRLTGSKSQVISSEQRLIVLKAADRYLNRLDETFVASLGELQSPYISKSDTIAVIEGLPLVQTAVSYDPSSILEVIGANFAKQVRGTLSKGETHYLQLQGGSLMEPGSSFPAEIPQIKGQTFTVTVFDVNSRGYTLKIEDTLLEVLFEISSGVTKD